ncbi:D-2-hydroxyacid dehydrogenase [Halalkalibacterium ligniniphilum]|uniref:D-2-hydroxyacid dehydrogenase n=1 Tax=Halalkalibacterium ligniniphilum TaxID=1134413 RepID=UPI00034BC2A4|nr:D-2-hydroxyacid dehydrogenase [Halalkalibacterium ligniniphilum]
MNIVSSARTKDEIKKQLQTDFPQLNFQFFNRMNEVGEALRDAEILITYGEDLTPELIEQAQALKWIMVISAGLDKMPFAAIKERNILVTNAKGIHALPMAEYTLAMILQVAREAKTIISHEQRKVWDRKVPMHEINGSTLGILGVGAIGQEIARLAKAFGMKVIGLNSTGAPVEWVDHMVTINTVDSLLADSDYVVSVLPLTKQTNGFMSYRRFEKMKPSSVFINIGRGKTVKQEELVQVLKQGIISHAILDVFEKEPLPEDHPFWTMENVTVTPHISGISAQYQPRAFEIFRHNLSVYLKGNGTLMNRIDLDKGY